MLLLMLDSVLTHFYKARAFAVVVVVLAAAVGWADVVGGVMLPSGSQKVGEDRYRSSTDFDGTMKYYKSVYPADRFPRKSIVNQPGVKAVHIENPSGKKFEGLNIYETNDEVRIFIVRSQEK